MIGSGETAQKLEAILQQKLWTGFRIGQVFSDSPSSHFLNHMPVAPLPADLDVWLSRNLEKIDEIWLALPLDQKDRIQDIIHQLRHHTVLIRMALDVFPVLGFTRYSITDMDGLPMLNLNASPISGINRFLKALEDRMLAALLLILTAPLLLLIAILVRLTSRGPILFRQKRHGWDGRVIRIYKFRTMVCHEESEGQVTQASRKDSRVTPLGRWLRRTSLDELPQLINVLQGRMSIVGPRPHALAHNAYYRDVINDYMQRHKVKPGITGWAQVNGWRGETDTLGKMEKRVEHDLYYIENWSLLLDLKIILLTVFRGFVNRNAY
jgi:putative colanic acid biosynthesis UDP-glucose lipid carrier transferase